MKTIMSKKWFWIGISLLALAFGGCGYNSMQQQEEDVFKAWGDLESNLQRRADLIPNLVNTVKGYAAHENTTLEAVIAARAKATSITLSSSQLGSAQAMTQFQQAQSALSASLGKLMVVAEQYPNLKADQHFSDLMHQLEGTENRINVARERYNEAVNLFNASIRKFPNSMTNGIFLKLERKEYFKAESSAQKAPEVKF